MNFSEESQSLKNLGTIVESENENQESYIDDEQERNHMMVAVIPDSEGKSRSTEHSFLEPRHITINSDNNIFKS